MKGIVYVRFQLTCLFLAVEGGWGGWADQQGKKLSGFSFGLRCVCDVKREDANVVKTLD